jgi:hypothetical protein
LQGTIEKVKYNEWATRMVHVPKRDGKTLCMVINYVTLNPSLKVQYLKTLFPYPKMSFDG